MPLSTEQQAQFDSEALNNKRVLIEELRLLGADLTVALGAIDAILLLFSTQGCLPDGANPLTDEDVAGTAKSAADFFAAIEAISAIATAAKDPANLWTVKIGKIVRANQLRTAR